jgi:PhzF family phenazine biosynthesis protein
VRVPLFQLDAFATQRFSGNPAAVMPMDQFPEAALMQAIAAENNLAETAFIVRESSDYRIRWFTPTTEVPLCGHATLASAAVVMERLDRARREVVFHSASGPLTVRRAQSAYVMDFPARISKSVPPPPGLTAALGALPVDVMADEFNYLVRLESAAAVRELAPDIAAISALDLSGLIVTAAGDRGYDFTSRYFAPAKGIPEDPVTGAAHCALAPYWSGRLAKNALRAYQASRRGGEIQCRVRADRVELEGTCVFYLEGEAEI